MERAGGHLNKTKSPLWTVSYKKNWDEVQAEKPKKFSAIAENLCHLASIDSSGWLRWLDCAKSGEREGAASADFAKELQNITGGSFWRLQFVDRVIFLVGGIFTRISFR